MDLIEGVGESSSPPRSIGSFGGYDIRNDVYNRLVETRNQEFLSNPDSRELLDFHFQRLPSRYKTSYIVLLFDFSFEIVSLVFDIDCEFCSGIVICLNMYGNCNVICLLVLFCFGISLVD